MHIGHYIKNNIALAFLIAIAFIIHMAVMMPSGTNFCIGDRCGLHFWGIHSHDAMWHLEIAATPFRSWPFVVPTYAGGILSGYNILMDLLMFMISLVGIPPVFTLFKIIPVLWFFFYTYGALVLLPKINRSKMFVFIALFLLYFADHFGYILQFVVEGSIFKGRQSFSLQSLSSLLNTQFALTLPILMGQLYLLLQKKHSLRTTLIMSVFVFFSIGLKFYGGVVSAILAFWYLIEGYISQKKISQSFREAFFLGMVMFVGVFIFYNPLQASEAGSVFRISPFATVHSVIEASDMIYLPDLVNARYFLYEHGWSPRLIYIELLSTFFYFVLNFGTRAFGIFYVAGKILLRKANRLEVYVFLTIFFAFLMNIMLIQRGDWWNTVQFGYYAIFLSNFLLALALYDLIQRFRKIGIAVVVLVLLFTIPGAIRTASGFVTSDTLYITRPELEAMQVLKKEPSGVVFNSFPAKKGYAFLDYKSSGYVSAFSEKPLYLAHLGPLTIIGIDFKQRSLRIEAKDCSLFDEVKYIYFVKSHDATLLQSCRAEINRTFLRSFENEEVVILKKR